MPNVGAFRTLPGDHPPVGSLTRVKLIVNTAPDVATACRLIIVSKEFSNNAGGISALKDQRYTHVYDSDANGTPSLAISAGVSLDRIFEGEVPYINYDDERKESRNPTGVPNGDGKKKRKLYAYIELNGTPTTTPDFEILAWTKESVMDPENIPVTLLAT